MVNAFPLHRAAQICRCFIDPGLGPVDPGPPVPAGQDVTSVDGSIQTSCPQSRLMRKPRPAVSPQDVRAALLDWQRTVGIAVQDVSGGPCAGMVSALVAAPVFRTSRAAWSSRLAPVSTRDVLGEATSIIKSDGLPCSETMWPTLAWGQPARPSLKRRRPARRLLAGC